MGLADIAGIGILFTACVIAGFAIGIWISHATGATWPALVGILAGFVIGAGLAALRFRQALR